MNLAVFSDIHGNLEAFQSVLADIDRNHHIDACLILGDVIDYGMHSNEIIDLLSSLRFPILGNIWGNHEEAVFHENYARFSTERGKKSAKYVHDNLTKDSWNYIANVMTHSGKYEFSLDGKKCLAVHGSLEDEYWKSISFDVEAKRYKDYDYIFSGHSHLPHFFEKYLEADNLQFRNKKKITFINPGSVGQPRNHNAKAQYAIFHTDSEEVFFCRVAYNIAKEQDAYNDHMDQFYKERLERGI